MFNRLRYDTCATKTELRDNVSIFSHTVDINRFTHSDPCQHDRGVVAGNTTSTVGAQPVPDAVHTAWGEMIAVENDLRGQTRPVSRCPGYDYIPKKGVISSKTMYRNPQPDIRTDNKSDLASCQMIDYRNMDGTAYQGVKGRSDGAGAGAGK
eukprot:jgi/Tetstr1/464075/TSEL_008880.t1